KKLTGLVGGTATAHRFRLPTEAEWEYACRAGTATRFWSGDAEADLARVGWYRGNSESTTVWPYGDCTTHPVSEKAANGLGLFDMHGNVWEWCADWYGPYPAREVTNPPGSSGGSARVFRGGSWHDRAGYCRAAGRDRNAPSYRDYDLGFRLARSSRPG